MTLISSIDGELRRIYLHPDTVGADIHPMDIYKEMRVLRKNDESLRKYNLFLKAFGNVPKGGGKSTERYVRCEQGTRIVPYDASHTLTVTGTIITDDGKEGIFCFDKAPLTVTTSVDINYVPPQVEVITLATGSGLDTLQDARLESVFLALLGKRTQDVEAGEIRVYEENGIAVRHTMQSTKNGSPSPVYSSDTIEPED